MKAVILFKGIKNASENLLQHKVFYQSCQMIFLLLFFCLVFIMSVLSCSDYSREPTININGILYLHQKNRSQNNRQCSSTGESHFKRSLLTALYYLTNFPKYLDFPKFTLFSTEESGIWLIVEVF